MSGAILRNFAPFAVNSSGEFTSADGFRLLTSLTLRVVGSDGTAKSKEAFDPFSRERSHRTHRNTGLVPCAPCVLSRLNGRGLIVPPLTHVSSQSTGNSMIRRSTTKTRRHKKASRRSYKGMNPNDFSGPTFVCSFCLRVFVVTLRRHTGRTKDGRCRRSTHRKRRGTREADEFN